MKILILGASGLIGSNLFRVLSNDKNLDIYGLFNGINIFAYFNKHDQKNLIKCNSFIIEESLLRVINKIKPDIVINAAGLTHHMPNSNNPLIIIPINSLFPHLLNKISELKGFRLIHLSSDCVFNGERGNYSETDIPNAYDLYGISKNLGELKNSKQSLLGLRSLGMNFLHSEAYLNGSLAKKFLAKDSLTSISMV